MSGDWGTLVGEVLTPLARDHLRDLGVVFADEEQALLAAAEEAAVAKRKLAEDTVCNDDEEKKGPGQQSVVEAAADPKGSRKGVLGLGTRVGILRALVEKAELNAALHEHEIMEKRAAHQQKEILNC